jgi:hypothetical protein
MAPSELAKAEKPFSPPPSSEDGYPWALQVWRGRERVWRWERVGMVPLNRRPVDLQKHAKTLKLRAAVRYVWVRHWTPGRRDDLPGWRACIDSTKTVGPVRP